MQKRDISPDTSKESIITLSFPLKLADRTLDIVTMRRPTIGDLLDFEPKNNEDVAGEVALLGTLCGLKKEEMRGLDSTDYAKLQEQYLRFRAVS